MHDGVDIVGRNNLGSDINPIDLVTFLAAKSAVLAAQLPDLLRRFSSPSVIFFTCELCF